MRAVFMGTPDFAVPSLDALATAHQVVAVVTRQDAVSGRGAGLVYPPVKSRAMELGFRVLQPSSLKEAGVLETLAELSPDVICVAAFGMLLPSELLELPRFGCINVHASLLPRYRGAAPIQRAILAGDEVTGVSIMRMEEGLDTGPFALQVPVPMDELNASALSVRLAEVGAAALAAVVDALPLGTLVWTAQDVARATYAPKVTRADVAVDPSLSYEEALRRIRASSSSATVRVAVAGDEMVLLAAAASGDHVAPGIAHCGKRGLVLGFSDGALVAERVRPAGKAAMTGGAWVCGFRGKADARWGPA